MNWFASFVIVILVILAMYHICSNSVRNSAFLETTLVITAVRSRLIYCNAIIISFFLSFFLSFFGQTGHVIKIKKAITPKLFSRF